MVKQDHSTKVGQRVRLKLDGQDSLYQLACAGSEGWVRDQSHDHLGYPTVLIEWDKDHWTYNGEPDRWALDAHFEPVGEVEMAQDNNELFKQFLEFQQFVASQGEGGPSEPEPDTSEEYQRALSTAFEAAQNCNAFLLIGVEEGPPQGGMPTWGPIVVNYYKDEPSGLILEAHISKLAAMAHQERAIDAVRGILQQDQE